MNDRADTPGDQAFRAETHKGTVIESTYAGARSFMRRRYGRDLSGIDIAVTGVPFDQATTNRPGARFGPEAIRRASAQLAWGPIWPWMFDPFDTLAVIDYGDCWYDHATPGAIDAALEAHAGEILDAGAGMLSLGGDHYVTYPLLKAHHARHGPLALVQFDAHRDVEEDNARRIDHGTMFRYAIEDGLIDPERSVQIGIRSTYRGERRHGMTIIHADRVHSAPPAEIAKLIARAVGDTRAYLTFDIDCLDPAFAPGTGTPVPGGLSTHQALSILRGLVDVDFAGADVVEVSPTYDTSEVTALAAATIALEYLCLKAARAGATPVPVAD